MLYKRAATSLEVRAILFKGAATSLLKDISISSERVADPLVKRYSYFSQGCGHSSCEGYFDFI
jgi:hypothetical protein